MVSPEHPAFHVEPRNGSLSSSAEAAAGGPGAGAADACGRWRLLLQATSDARDIIIALESSTETLAV